MTPKQFLFVEGILSGMTGVEAVKHAGYKTKEPARFASEMKKHPLIKQKIDEGFEERREQQSVNAGYVLEKLLTIANNTEKGNPQAALRAYELIGKHLGMYRDRQEISGPDGNAIEVEQRTREDVADFTSRIAGLAKRNGTNGVSELPKPAGVGGA